MNINKQKILNILIICIFIIVLYGFREKVYSFTSGLEEYGYSDSKSWKDSSWRTDDEEWEKEKNKRNLFGFDNRNMSFKEIIIFAIFAVLLASISSIMHRKKRGDLKKIRDLQKQTEYNQGNIDALTNNIKNENAETNAKKIYENNNMEEEFKKDNSDKEIDKEMNKEINKERSLWKCSKCGKENYGVICLKCGKKRN